MPSRPPSTPFYEDPATAELWRDITRLYEDFREADAQRKFRRVLNDLLLVLDPYDCLQCGAGMINAAAGPGTELACPKCQWRPVQVTAGGEAGT